MHLNAQPEPQAFLHAGADSRHAKRYSLRMQKVTFGTTKSEQEITSQEEEELIIRGSERLNWEK